MKHVLFISGCKDHSYRYRVMNQSEQLRLKGYYVVDYYYTNKSIKNYVKDFDFVIMHRVPFSNNIDNIIKKIKELGKKVFYDIDDIVFDMDYALKSEGINALNQQQKEEYIQGIVRYRKVLEMCDGVITSTKFLSKVAYKYNNNIVINRNALSSTLINISETENKDYRKPDKFIRIGYFSGSNTHKRDFLEVENVLWEILTKNKHVKLLIGGLLDLPDYFHDLEQQVVQLPLVHWTYLPNIIKNLDINIAPIEIENPFCKAKSEIKYIEAAILKIPTIASEIESYQYAIKNGYNGFIAKGKEEWEDSLNHLIKDEQLRIQMGRKAYDHVLEHYTTKVRSDHLIHQVEALMDR